MPFSQLSSILENALKSLMTEPLITANSRFNDEMLLTVNENQINDALQRFVTRNVESILNMRIELNDGWFRLFCTIKIAGIYTEVASNFKLVHIQLDRHHQRLVFSQQANTDVLALHAQSYIKKLAIENGIKLYRKALKKDPLGLILEKIQLAHIKDNVFYIDIGRWLRNNKKIMTNIYKFQVNYGYTAPNQLILKSQINLRDLLATNASSNIITESDNPQKNTPE